MSQTLRSTLTAYTHWLQHDVLPLWAKSGIAPNGASYERFDEQGLPDVAADKRARVQARQMFAFAYARHRGWISNAADLVQGLDSFIEQHAKVDDSPMFAHVLNADNEIIEKQSDLYDCAFFLLAYAWRYHVFGDLKALQRAEALLNSIELDLQDTSGGWREGNYQSPIRRQNPHMHLFEAFIFLFQVTRQGKWLAKAGEIFCLFETRFFDQETGVLLEYFDAQWQPVEVSSNTVVEPGHMLEWVWLLREYQELTGTPVDHYCHSLYHKALAYGLDHSQQLLLDEITPAGTVLKPTKRCWPMTEWIKASAAQARAANDRNEYNYLNDTNIATTQLLERYRIGDRYIDQLDDNGKVLVANSPASTLYHLLMAESETNRVLASLR